MTNRDVINALAFGGSGGGGGGTEIVVSDALTWVVGETVPQSVIDFFFDHDITNGYAIVMAENGTTDAWLLASVSQVTSSGKTVYRVTFRGEMFIAIGTTTTAQVQFNTQTHEIKSVGASLEGKTCRLYAAKLI